MVRGLCRVLRNRDPATARSITLSDRRDEMHPLSRTQSERMPTLRVGRQIDITNSAWMAAMTDTVTPNIELDPTTPLNTAYAIVETRYTTLDLRTLHYYGGDFFRWTGTHYETVDSNTMRSYVYDFMDSADCPAKNGAAVQFTPTPRRVTDAIDALRAGADIPSSLRLPSWLSGNSTIAPMDVIACKNGLLHSRTRELYQHTPNFFNRTTLPYDYDPHAPQPLEWLG